MKLLSVIYNIIFGPWLYVIADPADNSITLSKRLFRHMNVMKLDKAKVYVFRVPYEKPLYGFTVNPDFDKPAQLCDIQYNSRHRCIGFETLCPTVNRIFYDYRLPHDRRCKLSVKVRLAGSIIYYQICRPKSSKAPGPIKPSSPIVPIMPIEPKEPIRPTEPKKPTDK